MRYIALLFALMLTVSQMAFGFGSDTKVQIDEIKNNTGSDILLNPTDKVDISYFTGEKVLQSTSDGELEESAVTNIELGFLGGVTSSIQNQLDSKAPLTRLINTTAPLQGGGDLTTDKTLSITQATTSTDGYITSVDWNTFNNKSEYTDPLTTDGDLLYYNSSSTRLGIGSDGQLLTVNGGLPSWQDPPTSVSVTTKGDLQTYSTAPDRLPVGTDGQVLQADSAEATGLKWVDFTSSPTTTLGDLIKRGASADERLPIGSENQLLTVVSGEPAWADAPVSLPDQTGESGKYLKTNGTIASWNELNEDTNAIKDNLLECSGFDGCTPEGVITNGAGIDLSDTTSRAVEKTGFNTSKLNLTQSAVGTLDYTYTKTADFDGKQMVAYCEIKTANTGVTFSTMVNGVVQSTLEVSSSDTWKYYKIPFVGGDTSQGFKIDHVTATETPDIDVDNCFIGKAINVTREVGTAHFVGSLMYKEANCLWSAQNTASLADFAPDPDCVASEITGSILAPDTKVPAVKIPNAKTDGYYRVVAHGLHWIAGTNICNFALSDTNTYNNDQGKAYLQNTDNRGTNILVGEFRFDSTGSKQIQVVSKSNTTENCSVYGFPEFEYKMSVYFYPDDSSTIVTQDTELTAKTANEFSAYVSASGVVSDENYDFINGDCSESGATFTCTLNDIDINSKLNCSITGVGSSLITGTYDLASSSTSTLIYRTYTSGSSAQQSILRCSKQGADVNKSQTIVGKFQNINSTDLCQVSANGNSAQSVTANVTPIEFNTTEIKDNCNTWDGDEYIAKKDGRITIDGMIQANTSTLFRIEAYVDGTFVKSCSNNISQNIRKFSCDLDLTKDQVVSIRSTVNLTMSGTDVYHHISISELPDYEAIVKNLSNQKTKCQRKNLSSNLTSGGTVGDLAFSNLKTSKYYRINANIAYTNNNASYDLVSLEIRNDSNLKCYVWASGSDGVKTKNKKCEAFKPTATTLVTTVTSLTSGNAVRGGFNDGYPETWVELCELDDDHVPTTEF
jgi:hypothetical protein